MYHKIQSLYPDGETLRELVVSSVDTINWGIEVVEGPPLEKGWSSNINLRWDPTNSGWEEYMQLKIYETHRHWWVEIGEGLGLIPPQPR